MYEIWTLSYDIHTISHTTIDMKKSLGHRNQIQNFSYKYFRKPEKFRDLNNLLSCWKTLCSFLICFFSYQIISPVILSNFVCSLFSFSLFYDNLWYTHTIQTHIHPHRHSHTSNWHGTSSHTQTHIMTHTGSFFSFLFFLPPYTMKRTHFNLIQINFILILLLLFYYYYFMLLFFLLTSNSPFLSICNLIEVLGLAIADLFLKKENKL